MCTTWTIRCAESGCLKQIDTEDEKCERVEDEGSALGACGWIRLNTKRRDPDTDSGEVYCKSHGKQKEAV